MLILLSDFLTGQTATDNGFKLIYIYLHLNLSTNTEQPESIQPKNYARLEKTILNDYKDCLTVLAIKLSTLDIQQTRGLVYTT